MKFKMKFSYVVYVLTGIIIAVTLASAVINVMILTGAGRFVKGNVAVTSVSLTCSLLLFSVCLVLLITSGYSFKEKHLVVSYGVLRLKYSYDEMLAVAADDLTKKLYVQVKNSRAKDGYGINAVNVDNKYNDDFIAAIIDKNPNVKHKDKDPLNDSAEG